MRRRSHPRILPAAVVLSVLVWACSSPADPAPTRVEPTEPVAVIVDYSPTVSDVGGLMYLLSHPLVDVIAITLPETGEAGCALGVDVTLRILAMFDREEIPVACNADVAGHARQWPAAFLEGHEALATELPASTVSASNETTSDLIARVAGESELPVVLYAVAPLTNVAGALTDHPGLANDLDRIVIMGGAVDVPGNVEGASAEWNFWIDVPAAAAVIGSGVDITLVPLDAANDVPVPNRYQRSVRDSEQSEAIVYLGRLVELFPSVTSGFYHLWDELAASVAAGETYVTTEARILLVVEGGSDEGRTKSGDGTSVTVAVAVDDPDSFYEHFLGILAGA